MATDIQDLAKKLDELIDLLREMNDNVTHDEKLAELSIGLYGRFDLYGYGDY